MTVVSGDKLTPGAGLKLDSIRGLLFTFSIIVDNVVAVGNRVS